jgi:ACS family D-galactonate transporter-like MFS transporter
LATASIPGVVHDKLDRKQWIVVVLLAVSVFINYLDRGSLSVAAPLIKDELRLSASQLGVLLSAFFWTYSSFQFVSGWLVDRYEVSWVLATGFVLWSAATTVTGILHVFGWLLAARLVLGVGESVCYPSYSKILVRHFPEEQRGFANSVIITGVAFGPAFSTFVGGMAMARFGWRSFFVVVGVLSLSWLAPWFIFRPREDLATAVPVGRIAGVGEILRQRSAWGSFSGLFCTNYLNYFLLAWMPFYLVRERHFSLQEMAKIAAGCYLLAAAAALICGKISDRLIARGASRSWVRKGFAGGGLALGSMAMIGCMSTDPVLSTVMLALATMGYGICCSNLWAITQTLAGPAAAGRWTGMQNGLGNVAGVAAPALTGFVVERTGHFLWAFAIASAITLLGTISWIFWVGPIQQVAWKLQPEGE